MPGAWNDVPLSSMVLFYDTVLDGGYIKSGGGADSFCAIPGLTLTGWTEIELTLAPDGVSDHVPEIYVDSLRPDNDIDSSFWEYLTGRYTDTTNAYGPQSMRLGPGYEGWNTAMGEGDTHCFFDTNYAWISAVRWRTLSGRYDGFSAGPANDNIAGSIPLVPSVATASVSSQYATHESFEEPLFGLYDEASVWHHFDSGPFVGYGRVRPTPIKRRYQFSVDNFYLVTAEKVVSGPTPETLANVVAFTSILDPFDAGIYTALYFPVAAGTRYYSRFGSDQQLGPFTYETVLELLVETGMFPLDEDFNPAHTINPNDFLPEEAGVWVVDHVPDVPAGQGVAQSLRVRQVNPLTPYVQGSYRVYTEPFTITLPSKASFWANYDNPSTNAFMVGFNTHQEGDPTPWNSSVAFHNFYGSNYSTQPYYTPPGWTHYEFFLEPGSYVFEVRAFGAYSDGGYLGPSSMEVSKVQVETLAFYTPPTSAPHEAAWGILREEP